MRHLSGLYRAGRLGLLARAIALVHRDFARLAFFGHGGSCPRLCRHLDRAAIRPAIEICADQQEKPANRPAQNGVGLDHDAASLAAVVARAFAID